MNINTLYKSLQEGKITKNSFMFQVRRDPIASQWINGLTQYDSAIKILKSKRVLSEIKEEPKETYTFQAGKDTVKSVLSEIRKEYPHGATLHDIAKFVSCTSLTESECNDLQYQVITEGLFNEMSDEDEAAARATKIDRGAIELNDYMGRVKSTLIRKYDFDDTIINHLLKTYPKLIKMGMDSGDSPEYTAENIVTMDEMTPPELNECKTPEQIRQIDKLIPGEFRIGLRTEMDKGKDEKSAIKIVIKNLMKDPIFYTNEIAGLKNNRKRSDLMTPVDKKLSNLIDKANAMLVAKAKEKGDSAAPTKSTVEPEPVKEETMVAQGGKGITKEPVPGKEKVVKINEGIRKLIESFVKEIING